MDRVEGGSSALVQALVNGDIHLANLAAAPLVLANLDGADLVCVMGLVNKLVFQVMTVPEVRSVADLRGRTLASAPRNTADVVWQWFLPQHGLQPGVDVELREIPSQPKQMGALRRGEIHGMTLSPAGSAYLRQEGFNELVDFSVMDVDFQLGCVVTTRRFAQAQPDETMRYISAYVEAIRRYRGDRAAGLKVLRGYTGIADEDVLLRTYEVFARTFQDWPYPSEAGFATVIDTVAQMDSRAKGLVPADFIELRFLDDLRRKEPAGVQAHGCVGVAPQQWNARTRHEMPGHAPSSLQGGRSKVLVTHPSLIFGRESNRWVTRSRSRLRPVFDSRRPAA